MRFSIYQDSLIGERRINQDRMGYCFTSGSLLMVVADGMGGHAHGEYAAQIALQAAASLFQTLARPMLEDPAAFLQESLRKAHRDILKFQNARALPDTPRTTIVACVVQDRRAWWAHAGDSRFYWVREGQVIARSRDHSKVQNLIDLGLLHPDEAERHPERHLVLNCLGSPFEPAIELGGPDVVQRGDTLFLCTDGVWSPLPETDLVSMLCADPVLMSVPTMVRHAVERGGDAADNATAIAMTWEAADSIDQGIQSVLVPDGAITTTIAVGPPAEPEDPDPISDEEIERTIREIREAIERTGGA